jgi:hypothetical protein
LAALTDVEILRPEFDAHGYEIVMSRGPVVAKTQAEGKVSISRALAENLCNREGGSVKEQRKAGFMICRTDRFLVGEKKIAPQWQNC